MWTCLGHVVGLTCSSWSPNSCWPCSRVAQQSCSWTHGVLHSSWILMDYLQRGHQTERKQQMQGTHTPECHHVVTALHQGFTSSHPHCSTCASAPVPSAALSPLSPSACPHAAHQCDRFSARVDTPQCKQNEMRFCQTDLAATAYRWSKLVGNDWRFGMMDVGGDSGANDGMMAQQLVEAGWQVRARCGLGGGACPPVANLCSPVVQFTGHEAMLL